MRLLTLIAAFRGADPGCCPGTIEGSALDGLNEKICIQVQRVYDSCLQQEQLTNVNVTVTSYAQVVTTGCCCNAETEEVPPTTAPVPPITFESCRSSTMDVDIGNLSVERLCDRPCFARVRGAVQIPIDILFTDSRCTEYIGKAVVTVNRDVLLDARENPEAHRDLIVRVGGFSAYFVQLSPGIQDDVIGRSEQVL